MWLPCAYSCATLAQAIKALTVHPSRTFRFLQNSWVWKTKPKQLPRAPSNSLAAIIKKLSQVSYSQEAGGQRPCRMAELLTSTKHAEAGPCGLTKNTFIIFAKKNQAGSLK